MYAYHYTFGLLHTYACHCTFGLLYSGPCALRLSFAQRAGSLASQALRCLLEG